MKNILPIDISSYPELSDKGFVIRKGWTEELATDLVGVSTQQHILENTPNDALKRFTDGVVANKWYREKDRSVYSLHNGALAGIIWFALDDRPQLDAKYTFAIRLYENAIGKRLSLPFMKAVHDDFDVSDGVWLKTDDDNHPALKLYDKFGYQKVDETNGRVTMVYKKRL